MVELSEQQAGESTSLRVAVEGCGHGTLDAIYASITKSCQEKNWDSVDLVIIGGDFQAVRDGLDLNVTAMPAKYRQLGDFHKYYWGNIQAPYLTIFIGGNHEASNHLFELYYGGWVAPNIYYLGAANVIRVGPLKIAAMSGIWKGYDYRRPHFERLPYSQADLHSIYHVRELDTRKLLSYRSQVDIGLSHDWPKGIEWLGNHEQLFRFKAHLQDDAVAGTLGNVAAQQVLDRLRPPYWFSAHLHCKYMATKKFGEALKTSIVSNDHASGAIKTQNRSDACPKSAPAIAALDGQREEPANEPVEHQSQLSAWHKFHESAKESETQEAELQMAEQKERKAISERTGVSISAPYVLNETYKRLKLESHVEAPTSSTAAKDADDASAVTAESASVRQLDGCSESSPLRRLHAATESTTPAAANMTNPDAIEIDLSDEDDPDSSSIPPKSAPVPHMTASPSVMTDIPKSAAVTGSRHPNSKDVMSSDDHVNSAADMASFMSQSKQGDAPVDGTTPASTENSTSGVSEEMRAKLAALSNKFVKEQPTQASPALPHPEGITNEIVRFLALSKCAPKQHFLQLLCVSPTDAAASEVERPVKLQYDPEWLAISRVFAPELQLGGSERDRVPNHQGDTYYRERILEEEKWVQEHIVEKEKLDVPLNFRQDIAIFEPGSAANSRDLPREKTNSQTTTFCQLIGIENKFDISEEERDAREAAGPREPPEYTGHRGGGGRAGRGGGRGHNHNYGQRGRGANRGYRGRGRAGRW